MLTQEQDHRKRHNLDIPQECNWFKIDDYVKFNEDGTVYKGYIYCFRQFGYNWFAWIYFDKNNILPTKNIYVEKLSKIEE